MTLGDYADALGFVEKGGPSIRRGAGRAEPFLRTTLQGPSEIQPECARKGSRSSTAIPRAITCPLSRDLQQNKGVKKGIKEEQAL